jgi:hypothetical protein
MDADLVFADCSAGEPMLDELLADPVLHAILRRDGLSLGDLEAAIAVARARLACIPDDQDGSSSLSQ